MEVTAQLVRELFSYNSETGIFTRNFTSGGIPKGAICGRMHYKGYIFLKIKQRGFQAHRVAWLYMTGKWPNGQIDHINGNRGDNRFCNLRDVDASINAQNLHWANRKNKANILGVHFHKAANKFVAQISLKKKKLHLGCFETAEEAHQAYLKKKREIHAGCTI